METGRIEPIPQGTVTSPHGFVAGATSAGIKKEQGALDLGILFSQALCLTAGVFTCSGIKAAAVTLSQQRLIAGKARAVVIWEKKLSPEDPYVGLGLNNLADLYRKQGQYSQAEPLYKRSLAIRENALGTEHPQLATLLNSMGQLYWVQGRYVEAEPLYKRSLAIREKALGGAHPAVALSLNNLALLYVDTGRYVEAEQLYKRSLAISEKALGGEHPIVALGLNNLALLYVNQGRYMDAEPLYQRSLAIREKVFGPEHPDVAQSLSNISNLFAAQGKYRDSFELKLRVNAIQEKLIDQVSGASSTDGALQFLSTLEASKHSFLALVAAEFRQDKAACREALGLLLKRKGILLETQRRMQQALLDMNDQEAVSVLDQLSVVRTQISKLAFADASGGGKNVENLKEKLQQLHMRKDALESTLGQLSKPYEQSRKVSQATVEEVSKCLPQGSLLVEFARTNFYNFQAKGKERRRLPAHYLSFLLLPNGEQNVILVDHGPAEEVDHLVEEMKKDFLQSGQDKNYKEKRRKLHDILFSPIQREIGVPNQIFLCPDGPINMLPFEVLLDSEGKYLIEKTSFNYLSAGRDLVGFSKAMAASDGTFILVGDPNFDLDPQASDQILNKFAVKAKTDTVSIRSPELRGLHFERLPGTREEIQGIGKLIDKSKCEMLLDEMALKEVIYSRKAPRVLHLATHGFFLDTPFENDSGVIMKDPLVRSGLALAGANRFSNEGSTPGRNGILTAEEVLGLPLRGTELVVLSACQTGLGEIKSGEGVFGLRRAFTQVGVRSLVMSMWSVPDLETQELMEQFYQNFCRRGRDRCQALREAILSEKKIAEERYGNENPLYWGAFVFLGQAK
jgi:CHAT domain-containing protein/Tfp pilus assembly protein PilF